MPKMPSLTFVLVLAATTGLGAQTVNSASPSFPGTWTLVSWTAALPSGDLVHPFGEDAVGRLVYDAGGRMAVQLMRRDRPQFAAEDPLSGTADEALSAYEGYLAYYGTYEVDRQEGTVTHVLEAALFPNWIGTEQVRRFEFEGEDRLTLSPPPIESSVTGSGSARHVLVWRREP